MIKFYVISVYSPFNWKNPLSWISLGIRKVTRFKWHHTALLVLEDNEIFIIESDIKGVVKVPYGEWVKNKEVTVHRVLSMLSGDEIIDRAYSRIDKTKYDFKSLLFHHVLNKAFGIWFGPTKEGKQYDRFTCSEFVAWCLGWRDAYKVEPKQIYEYLPIVKYFEKASELNHEIF